MNSKKYILDKFLGEGATCKCYLGEKLSPENSNELLVKDNYNLGNLVESIKKENNNFKTQINLLKKEKELDISLVFYYFIYEYFKSDIFVNVPFSGFVIDIIS